MSIWSSDERLLEEAQHKVKTLETCLLQMQEAAKDLNDRLKKAEETIKNYESNFQTMAKQLDVAFKALDWIMTCQWREDDTFAAHRSNMFRLKDATATAENALEIINEIAKKRLHETDEK